MALNSQKSTTLTNLDAAASPFITKRPTSGEGGEGFERQVDEFLTLTASGNDDSTYQFVRVPSNAILKEIIVSSPTQGAGGMMNIGAYYATDSLSASSKANHSPLVAADAIDEAYFSTAFDPDGQAAFIWCLPGVNLLVLAGTVSLDVTTKWLASAAKMPLWQMLGLASDPGGNIDIALTNSEAAGTGAGLVYMSVKLVK